MVDTEEREWQIPLNGNAADDVDADIVGTQSQLSELTPTAGVSFYAANTGGYFVGTGNAWELQYINGGGVSAEVVQTESLTLADTNESN